jgi:hypothetical protein
MDALFTSTGRLRYGRNSWRLQVDTDQELADYYRALLPKAWYAQRGRYPAHITVSRNEEPVNKAAWKQYDGQEVEFFYCPGVKEGKIYYWLDVYCVRLEEIRLELGLPAVNLYEPPLPGFRKRFHMTCANIKGQ